MSVRLDLKVAIIKSGRTQRALAAATNIPEIKLSIRGLTWPSSMERAALAAALGEDHFTDAEMASASAEVRSRR